MAQRQPHEFMIGAQVTIHSVPRHSMTLKEVGALNGFARVFCCRVHDLA